MKPKPTVPPRTYVAALVTGAFFASLSVTMSYLATQATIGIGSGPLPTVLITAGALAGSAAGGWYSQPLAAWITGDSRKTAGRRGELSGRR